MRSVRWIALVLVLLGVVAWAVMRLMSWSNPQPARVAQQQVDLEAFNRARVEFQAAFLDSLTLGKEWEQAPGGMRVKWLERVNQPRELKRGEWVHWNARVALADDTVCFHRPLAFKWESTDVPTGFHELARLTGEGDSVEVWLPSHMAWGLTGYGELVPPDVVIHLNFRVEAP